MARQSHRSILFFLLTTIVAFAFIFLAIWTWGWMQKPTSFPIKKVVIRGDLAHESAAELGQLVQSRLIGGFFSLNLSAVKQAIFSLPWIAQVSFRRVWPDVLQVHVTEQTAIARFGNQGALNAEGVVF